MKRRLGDILKFIVFLGIGIFFIYWFLLKLDADEKAAIWQSFLSAKWGWVGVAWWQALWLTSRERFAGDCFSNLSTTTLPSTTPMVL